MGQSTLPKFQDTGMVTNHGQEQAFEDAVDKAHALIAACRSLTRRAGFTVTPSKKIISSNKDIDATFAAIKVLTEALIRSGQKQHESVLSALMITTADCALTPPSIISPIQYIPCAAEASKGFNQALQSSLNIIMTLASDDCKCERCKARRAAE